jgi:hypothetical protein
LIRYATDKDVFSQFKAQQQQQQQQPSSSQQINNNTAPVCKSISFKRIFSQVFQQLQ